MCRGKAPYFLPWSLPKTPLFWPWQLRKTLLFTNICLSSFFLAPKSLFVHVGQLWKPPPNPIFSWGPLPKPPIFKPSAAHIYHLILKYPLPLPREFWTLISRSQEARLLCPGFCVVLFTWIVDAYLYTLPCVLESIWGKLCTGLTFIAWSVLHQSTRRQ